MLRKIILTAVIILTVTSLIQAENYAVLITGCTPDTSYNYPALDSYDSFWNDTFLMWEALFLFGWKDENIFVIFGEGEDWTWEEPYQDPRYVAETNYNQPPWNITQITDYSAYYEDVENIFNWLAEGNPAQGIPQMTSDDFLFVWTFDHGVWDPRYVGLRLMNNEVIWDWEFAPLVDQVQCGKRVFFMGQCYSGGFIDNLQNEDTVILTACQPYELSCVADDDNPDGGDPLENEDFEYMPYAYAYYHHSEFNYHVINAVRMETVGYFNYLWEPDTDFNGLTSILEVKDWHFVSNSLVTEDPMYSDLGEIGGSVFLNIPPYPPQNLQLEEVEQMAHLTWDPNLEYDLAKYYIYRYIQTDQGDPPAFGRFMIQPKLPNTRTSISTPGLMDLKPHCIR